jgi:hypothetical protein
MDVCKRNCRNSKWNPHLGGLSFFSFGFLGDGEGQILFIYLFLGRFPICSDKIGQNALQVPNLFPKMFPIAPQFVIPSFVTMVPLPSISKWGEGHGGSVTKHAFVFGEGSIFRLLSMLGSGHMFQKYW